jgi:hypothetical protein
MAATKEVVQLKGHDSENLLNFYALEQKTEYSGSTSGTFNPDKFFKDIRL